MKKIPKYNFKNTKPLEFEITKISSIYKKSKSKLITPHRQDFYGVFYFANSAGKHFVDFKEYKIKKDDIYLISSEQVHYFRNIENTKGIVILFTNSFLDNDYLLEQVFEQNTGNLVYSLNTDLRKNFKILLSQIKSVYQCDKKLKTELLKKYLEIILLEIYQLNQENLVLHDINQQRFFQFKKDVKSNIYQHKDVQFYAAKQFITSKTLNLVVRKIIDKSAKQYLMDYVILLAKRLLANTNHTVAEISYELGFEEPTNFVKFFKKKERISPSLFRKKYIHM